MTTHIEREFEAYRKDDAEARAILDLAASESRDLTAEESERFDRLFESSAAHKDRADKLTIADKTAAEVAEALRSTSTTDAASGEPPATRDARPDAQILAAVKAAQAHIRGESVEPFVERVFSLTPDPASVRKHLQEALDETRAIANFSDGGKLWVADFATRVAVYQRTTSPWFNIASVITADNGRTMNLPNVSADPTSYKPGEGTAITAADATWGTAVLTTDGYKALGYISAEAEEDEVVGFLPIMARVQGRSVGYQAGTAFSATILTGATNGGTAAGLGGFGTAAGTFLGYEDLIALRMGIALPYRSTGVFVASNGAIQKFMKWRDANGQYLLQPSIAAGQPTTILGDPVYEDPGLATPASATKSVLYCDPSSVVIKQVPLRVAVSTEYAFNTDHVAIKTVLRAGVAVVDAAGIRYLVSANT